MIKQIQHLALIGFILLLTSSATAQNCNCTKDFSALDQLLRKTPAFKDNKKLYIDTIEKLRPELTSITSNFECLVLLNKLTIGVKDNHVKVFGMPKNDKLSITNSTINLDSLKQELSKRPLEAIEGVYQMPDYVTLGVYKKQNEYRGIILKSELENWKKGEIMYTLIPYGEDLFLTVFGQQKNKNMVAVSERIKNGVFLRLGLHKNNKTVSYHSAPEPDSLYIRKEVNDNITYIKVGSFNSFYPTLSDAEAFYATLKNSLSKENLIVDLRDNGGGGARNSDILYEILKEFSSTKNIFILVNHNTASNAEQFTVNLKNLSNTTILGDKTQGTLAYELKKNISNELPCGKFLAIITSKRHKEYLEYESVGVTPDILLNYNSDWIEQTVNIINAR